MDRTVSIDRRFCGPKNSGNGGYVCGLLAEDIGGPARAKLTVPPPLEKELKIRTEGDNRYLVDDDRVIGEASPANVSVEIPTLPEQPQFGAAREVFLASAPSHPLPYCFVCGPNRDDGDGLRIFSGPVDGSPVNADIWTPTSDLADDQGLVAPRYIWSALDCPTSFSLRLPEGSFFLLGTLAVDIYFRPPHSEPLKVIAWPTGSDGRKHFADGALVNFAGDVVAVANSVWIEIQDPKIIEKFRSENE